MTKLTRWNPRNELEITDMFRPIERVFEDLWRGWPASFESDTTRPLMRPAMDVIENDNNLTVRVDLPGMKAEDVQVEIENDTLTIQGEMGDTIEKEGERYHYRERRYGSFQRSVRLPNTLDTDKVEASFDNGVLNIQIPKQPQAQPKQIAIKAGNK